MVDVTRGEFELLKQIVADNQKRLDAIDEHGTRGVGIVQVQLNELIKDLGDLKLEFHEAESTRRSNRKWMAGFILTLLATMGAVIGVVLELITKVH